MKKVVTKCHLFVTISAPYRLLTPENTGLVTNVCQKDVHSGNGFCGRGALSNRFYRVISGLWRGMGCKLCAGIFGVL